MMSTWALAATGDGEGGSFTQTEEVADMGKLADTIAEQSAERRRQVLVAARKMIERRGMNRITVRALASEGRVSVPTLYKFFGDKETLLTEAVTSSFSELLAEAEQRGIARIFGLLEACLSQASSDAGYSQSVMQSLLDTWRSGGDRRTRLIAVLARRFKVALMELREDGHLVPGADVDTLVELLAGHCVIMALRWTDGQLPEQQLRPRLYYGVAVILLGVVEAETRAEIQPLINDCLAKISHPPTSES